MATLALPRGWPDHVRSSLLHAIAFASAALAMARSRRVTQGLRTDLEPANHEIALVKEELALKDARWSRLSPRRRPHYMPVERMRTLQLKAPRRWFPEEVAEMMMLDDQTLKAWMRRIDEGGVPTRSGRWWEVLSLQTGTS